MLPACHGPIWVIDDLTPCFKRNFLRVIFPLTACGLSLVLIVLRLVRCYIQSRKDKGYKPLSNGNVPETAEDEEEEETDLMLYKATSRVADQPLEIDRPRGEIALITLETIALLGEVGLCLAVLYTGAEGRHGTIPVVGQTVSWAYILFLVSIRLLFSITGYQSSLNLWNHTACLYGLQWIFAVFLFRSAIIHPLSRRALIFTSTEFALSCVLLLIGVTSRKGNKAVLVPQQDGLEPSREPMASLLSVASFSWLDSLVWEGYKKPLEISNVWNLKVNEQAASVLIDWRQAKRTNRLAWRLVRYFDRTLLLQGLWTIFSNLFTFLPTWLLRNILQYVEDPRSTPMNAAWFYVVLLFVSAAIQAVADGQGLWIGRKLSVKLRAIIIGEIYAKALRRRAGATVKSTKKENEDENQVGNVPKKPDPSPKNPIEEEGDSQANIGTIINLMAIDSFKVSEVSAYLHFLWAAVPVQIIMAIALLYKILGFSSLAGIVLMVLILPLNLIIAKQFSKAQNNILKGTDARIHSTNEVLQNIRIIKYFAWEQRFEDIVNEKRKSEVKYLRKRYILWTLAATLWYGTPILITFTSFFIYTVVEKKDLVPSVAFPALSMFALLRVPLDQLADMVAHVQESKVSIDRVEKYLDEDETEKYSQLSHTKDTSQPPKIGLENATLSWGSSDKKDEDDETTENSESFRLIDVNLDFKLGKLNVIAGPTGSGKTSLLMALLGEMSLVEGKVHLPGGMSDRTDLPIDPETSLTESIAYCAQEAWLVNATIKENITFASPFNKRRYETVLQVCALERDLQILDAGDQTLVGEKGISLSGGQKQRISLARAMYSNARHLLLDDCLSAVDSHTAKHIFHEAIMGPLMLNRTCILVTHNVSLTVPHSDFVVVLDNGKISAQGSPNEIVLTGALGEDILKSRPPSGGTSGMPSRVPSNLEEQVRRRGNTQSSHANGTTNGDANGTASKPKQDEEGARGLYESKATGSVKMATIKMYLRSMGSWYYWVLAVIVFAAQQLGSLATNIWIRQWANSYQVKQKDVSSVASISHFKLPSVSTNNLPWALFSGTSHNHTEADFSVSEGKEVKVSYYLGMYAAIGIAYLLISMFREAVLFWGSLHASWGIHRRLLHAVMHAKFKFFDSTPLGQLMNRFSKDVEAIDQEVAPVAIGMLHCLASVILIVILISVITPGFLIAGVFITLIYAALGTLYIHSSRDLKRLESVERSPLYQQFGETLSGIVTIRAYGDSARFILDNHQRINTYNRPYIYLWASNRWLAFRVDMIGALVSFFAGAFVIMNAGTIDAGAAGLSLTYAVTFSENMLWLVRLYSSNEQNMNSVERMKEYLDVDQEADAIVHDSRPEPNWPSEGKLNFIDYSTRYRPDLDPVLKKVNFSVQPGEKVGIVGRTGAGKSSLALALFRGLEAEEGKIIIDGVDISQIGLQDLRKSITIVPQDPTLFTGTIRSNLDPFNVFTDEEIFTALRRVHLIGATGSQYSGSTTPLTSNASTLDSSTAVPSIAENKNIFLNLKSPVTEHGSNLSQGQRQLLCLARALLKNPRVLMMDEATASIDYNTDSKIQDTLRELKESTIITIAHRLQTIIDYDKVLVLDHGEVVEFDGPWQLINKEGGSFRGMCENSGTLDTLLEGAKKAWEQKRLVDDE